MAIELVDSSKGLKLQVLKEKRGHMEYRVKVVPSKEAQRFTMPQAPSFQIKCLDWASQHLMPQSNRVDEGQEIRSYKPLKGNKGFALDNQGHLYSRADKHFFVVMNEASKCLELSTCKEKALKFKTK